MARASRPSEPDPEDAAAKRHWADEARRRGESGELADDSEYLKRRLTEEKRKLTRR
jgi:hypothetical protein